METRARKKARPSCSPWPAVPTDIAGEVLLRLRSYADRVCFGAVCRSWRLSAEQHPLPPRLPCLVFADGTFRGFPEDDQPFRLPAAAGYHGSCGEWLVFKRDDGAYSLASPFSKAPVAAPLPSLSSVRAHHEPIRAVDERVVPEYDMRGLLQRELSADGEPEPRTLSVRKLVVCPAGVVAVVVGEGRLSKFALCRPGAASWSVSSADQWRRFKDMVVHQGELYAVDHNEDLLAVTVGEDGGDGAPTVSGIGRAIEGAPLDLEMQVRRVTLHYLVDSGDALLMVRRAVCRARRPGRGRDMDERFAVFKADFRSSRWAEVSTLGDGVVLFVGRWCSRAVRVPDGRREQWAGRVFFLEDGVRHERQLLARRQRYSLSAFNVSSRRTHSVLPAGRSRDGDDLPATWLFPSGGGNTIV